MYQRQTVRSAWSIVLLCIPLVGCKSTTICPNDDLSCQPLVELIAPTTLSQGTGLFLLPQEGSTELQVRLRGIVPGADGYPLWLVGDKGQGRPLGKAGFVADDPSGDGSGIYSLKVAPTNLLPRGRYFLRAGAALSTILPPPPQFADGTPVTEPEITVIKRTIAYQPPVVLAQTGQTRFDYPMLNQLGFVGSELLAFAGGTDGLTTKQLLKRFRWNASSLLEVPLSAFWGTPWELDVRVGFGAAQEFLFHMPRLMPPSLRCSTKATNPGECVSVDPPFPADSQTLAVSADGKWAAYAAKDGQLWTRDLGGSGMWQVLVTTKPPMAKQVLGVWLVDVNGDGKADVVGAWQDGQAMTARVFVGSGTAFSEDEKWSQAVAGIGPSAVSAMAMGDVDGDGYADLVVARGLTVTVQQNLFGTFAPVWKGDLDAQQAGTRVSALAVGRVSGNDPMQSLDIVAASYTDYDAMGKCSLYLQVFRPQPPTAQ